MHPGYSGEHAVLELLGLAAACVTQSFCPNCRCNILNFKKFVGTSTVSATQGKGSLDERRSYYKLYGELMATVPHYTKEVFGPEESEGE